MSQDPCSACVSLPTSSGPSQNVYWNATANMFIKSLFIGGHLAMDNGIDMINRRAAAHPFVRQGKMLRSSYLRFHR
jgi:hypothetical protein